MGAIILWAPCWEHQQQADCPPKCQFGANVPLCFKIRHPYRLNTFLCDGTDIARHPSPWNIVCTGSRPAGYLVFCWCSRHPL